MNQGVWKANVCGFCVTSFRRRISYLWAHRGRRGLRGRMKRWVLAGALAFAAAGHTLASDLPPPPPAAPRAPAAYVPAITPAYNWGGIYFGLNLGYGFGTSNFTDTIPPPAIYDWTGVYL